jgi:hypothetical protein
MRHSYSILVLAVLALGSVVAAQPLERLTGKVVIEPSEPAKDIDVHVDAIFGFAGGDFLGQRTFTARTNARGEWALLAFKAGAWLFDASAPGRLPDVIVLPFNLVSPPGSGLLGQVPGWHPILKPAAMPAGDVGVLLASALEAARAGRSDRATPLLARLSDSGDTGVLTAAGRICLILRDAATARPFFRRALERDPRSFGAAVGMGSSALMQRDVDSAAHAFDEARSLSKDKDERGYLAAAIAELNKAHNVMKGTY